MLTDDPKRTLDLLRQDTKRTEDDYIWVDTCYLLKLLRAQRAPVEVTLLLLCAGRYSLLCLNTAR